MIRSTTLIVAALGLAVSAAPQDPPVFKAGVTTVPVYATVVDDSGRLVTHLSASDFEIYDNDKPQPISLFDNRERPITIVVMLDRSISMRPHFGLLEEAARAFVTTVRPDDRVRIGSFADEIRIEPASFTSDQADLRAIVDGRLVRAGATPLWGAVDAGLDALSEEAGQRVLVIFTDGRDSPGIGNYVPFREVLARVSTEPPIVYGIGLDYVCEESRRRELQEPTALAIQHQGFGPVRGGRGTPQFPRPGQPGRGPVFPPRPSRPAPEPWRPDFDECRSTGPDPDLRQLVEVGGGGYFELESTADLAATFERVAHEIHTQYLIGFVPTNLDGTLHDLEVRVRGEGLTVRARQSYLASSE